MSYLLDGAHAGVNDNDNTAAWAPVNVATNLILSNSNRSIMTQPLLLVQNRECKPAGQT